MEEIGGSHHTVEESGTVDWTWASKTLSKIRTLSLSLTICSVFFFEKADEFVAKKIHRYTEFAAKFMFSVGKVHAVSHSRTCVSVTSTVSLALAWEWRMNNSTQGRRLHTHNLRICPMRESVEERQSWQAFEENSQDLFLLREFQNIREGPDTCISQRRVSKFSHFKKNRVFRKADMTARMEPRLFYTQGRQKTGNHCSRNVLHVHLPLSYGQHSSTHFLKHSFNEKKPKKQKKQKQDHETEAKGTHCTFTGLKESTHNNMAKSLIKHG